MLSAGLFGGALVAPTGATAASSSATTDEEALLAKIDHAREVHGLPALRTKASLMRQAHEHSESMSLRNRLFHTADLGAVCCWSAIGENIAMDFSVAHAHRALMSSPGHRANILDPRMRRVGVGIVERAGQIWVTEVFSKPA